MVDVTENSKLVIQQYRNSEKLMAIIDGFNKIVQDELITPALEIEKMHSIEHARAIWLDHIGERLGIRRPYLSSDEIDIFGFDDNGIGFDQGGFSEDGESLSVPASDDFYRKLIIARGAQLLTDGTVESMNEILVAAFDDGHYIDHTNMSMSVRLDGDYTLDQINLILNTNLITKPSGVRLQTLYVVPEDDVFGFDDNGLGFDQAGFSTTVNLETGEHE